MYVYNVYSLKSITFITLDKYGAKWTTQGKEYSVT